MNSQLEQLLLELRANRVSREHVKQYLRNGLDPTAPDGERQGLELVRCRPVWQAADGTAGERPPGQVVLLAGVPAVEAALRDATVDVRGLRSDATGLAERYTDLAGQVLAQLRALLVGGSPPRTLVQLVVPGQGEDALLAGLFGMVTSAGLENPRIVPQLVVVDTAASTDSTVDQILANRDGGDRVVRLRAGVREVLTWQELARPEHTVLPWREGGTYVITGGLGGLGLIFARDVLRSVRSASVLLTGRSPLDDHRRRLLEGLRGPHAHVEYARLDVTDAAGVDAYLGEVRREHGPIHGVMHCAGVLRDGFVLNKSTDDLRAVLAPKVAGTLNLDASSKDDSLDFFALFSSTAAVTGNVGQADYAAANAFLDAFAHHRDGLVIARRRSGRSLSLNWPLWAEGGMPVDAESERTLRERTGMHALRTDSGVRVLYESLASTHPQVMAVEGDGPRIRRTFLERSSAAAAAVPEAAVAIDDEAVRDKVVRRLKQLLGSVIGLPTRKIEAETPLESYGIDSIGVTRLNRKLAKTFADLPTTLLYECRTVAALADHLMREHRQTCLHWTGTATTRQVASAASPMGVSSAPVAPRAGDPTPSPADAVAIIGMSGRFPNARNLGEYWENLAAGRNCVTEIPEDRWALDGFYHPDRDEAVAMGLSYSKWGGFLDGFAEFDPLFFAISPHEAMTMDPQERLFLQESWNALEDAGYTRGRLAEGHGRRVGVFAGVSKTGFDLYGPDLWKRNERLHPLTSFASVANRVSYLLDLRGPSLPVDTLCSSSLTAVHEAMEHLRRGECDVAIAGGVNLYLHQSNYTLMSGKRMLSGDGTCRSFGAGGDGFVPGEGVAVVLLKRLSDAERDGDAIHAVIRGSSINHGGRTNGYTVPNPMAQAEVVRLALDRAGVSADAVSYVEAHGTGTELGDPIEVDGLTEAFTRDTDSREYCAIGSAKSNIGHLEAAAGIAGLLKVVLQLQRGQLVPSLHAQDLNPNIDFAATPFRLQREAAPWPRPTVQADGKTVERNRIAGVSSFGAGGANAHVVVEEYRQPAAVPANTDTPQLIVLSARDTERLRERARDLLGWLRRQDAASLDLRAVAYTLQLGREAMEARLALSVATADELITRLAAFVAGDEETADLYLGAVTDHRETLAALGTDSDMAATVDSWIEKGKVDRLLDLWVKGLSVNWAKLHGAQRPRMLRLPGYPFARERYWVGDLVANNGDVAPGFARLHPLVHTNTSTLDGQRFDSHFAGTEFFLADHVVNGRGMLSGAAFLEMARAALDLSFDERPQRTVLRDVVWAQPLVADRAVHVRTTLDAVAEGGATGLEAAARVAFEISSVPDGRPEREPVVHSQGAILSRPAEPGPVAVDVAALRAACDAGRLDAEHCYRAYDALGLTYGPAHRAVESVEIGRGQAVARLRLPSEARVDLERYVLHPSMLDAALQSSIGLFDRDGDSDDPVGGTLNLPFALDELEVLGPCTTRMWAWVRYSEDDRPDSGIRKVDIDLLDDAGVPRCRLRGLASRAYDRTARVVRADADLRHDDGARPSPVAVAGDPGARPRGALRERASRYLTDLLATELRVPAERIDASVALEQYGIDSIMAMNLTNRLERVFGSLPKTLFYEYQSLDALVEYFLDAQRKRLAALLAVDSPESSGTPQDGVPRPATVRERIRPAAGRRRRREPVEEGTGIAVIGLAGRYPQARDVREFWRNLAAGKDCVTEIPADRWDHRPYFDPDKDALGRTYTKWGGFLDKVDHFDPLFFNIAPREAAFMDPQERLFLECVHETFEDAGYTRDTLSRYTGRGLPGDVGVFVGVMYQEYQLYGAQEQARGRNVTLSGSASTIANRVSYVFELHGPSLAVDTMCSSSLTALHLACQSLRTGGCELAVAGGVNLSLHPNKYLMLGSGKYASSTGRCESFGAGGDGYVPGEGVGAVLLKPLARAREDGDTIYGVIRGASVNHGGKTNGYSVPNPRAQYNVIGHALREAGVDAGAVSYVEAHGTGTSLGDPIEVTGLTRAFREYTERTRFCAIGSVKSNIGHAESAAGIAALTKVLLQMKHGQLVPSLHSDVLNPNIDFDDSPFYVQRELARWRRPTTDDGTELPRIAGISSFGAGGSNAHVIVEEYLGNNDRVPADGPAVIVLSGRTENGLRAQAEQLLRWTTDDEGATAPLADVAYTLQTGREAYEERLAFVAATTGELTAKLEAFLAGAKNDTGLHRGRVDRRHGRVAVFTADDDQARRLDEALARRSYDELLELWAVGLTVDWTKLPRDATPRRVSMPTYPFQGERYWLAAASAGPRVSTGPGQLHPLLHTNISTLGEQRFTSVYTGEEFFLRDHQVMGERVLSGAACLELARAAVAVSLDEPYRVASIVNVVWSRPITVRDPDLTVQVRLRPTGQDEVAFEISTPNGAGTTELIHSEGVVRVALSPVPDDDARVDLSRLRDECRQVGPDADELYSAFEARGIAYGPGHRGVRNLWTGAGQVLARLVLPAPLQDTAAGYGLHPSLVDSALQACGSLLSSRGGDEPLMLPFALDEARMVRPCPPEVWAWLREGAGQEGEGTRRLDIDLCDDEGRVCVRLRGVAVRAHTAPATADVLLAAPRWVAEERPSATDPAPEGLVLVAELPRVASAMEAHGTARVVRVESDIAAVDTRYTDYALLVLSEVKRLLGERTQDPVLVQLVASAEATAVWTGLAAILKSAGRENPRLLCQTVLVDHRDEPERAASQVTAERAAPAEVAVRHLGGVREVLRWQEEDADRLPAEVPWQDGGVYLITGGTGGLGSVFAQDIATRVRAPRIVIVGRSPLDEHKDALLERLRRSGAAADYEQADVAVRDEVVRLVRRIRERCGRVDGVLHCAGLMKDAFVLRKDADEFSRVLAPKVAGLVNLDEATHDVDLDFLVAFSSVAGVLGNVGQADYAAANAFMDAFVAHRNTLVARGERRGRTLSVDWPLWADGGMHVDAVTERSLRERFGLVSLPAGAGVRALYRALASRHDQVLVLAGNRPVIRRTLLDGLMANDPVHQPAPSPEAVASPDDAEASASDVDRAPESGKAPDETTTQQAVAYFKRILASAIDLPAARIDAEASLADYGVDSVMAMEMIRTLENVFGSLPKTLFFEHRTIAALARHFLESYPSRVRELLPASAARTSEALAAPPPEDRAWRIPVVADRAAAGPVRGEESTDIAIIGLAGRYPQARDVREFWRNLAAGKDCVTAVPGDRWDHSRYFDPDKGAAGRSYSKWGGFIDGVYDFDPQMFNISPREAEIMDPQERLFLQCVHETLEDAGYVRDTGKDRTGNVLDGRVGVFVGVMYEEYQLLGAQEQLFGRPPAVAGNSASVANRVSYFFNLRGPSMSVDTMCSSSLTAVHLACQSLQSGDCEVAVAGGVNVSLHPNKYLLLSQGRLASGNGRCASFGADGDGYVPGEGVGAVLLKPLAKAVADGDRIYGVVKGTAVNHHGKTNGYAVPDPLSQADVVGRALARAGVDARSVSYIEASSTGTPLGDPIEIEGLCKAFGAYTEDRGFCAIGSVKSNIGHAESAAGIAGITKVLLQLQHGRLAPSLHTSTLNQHIDFERTPFVVQRELAEWPRPEPADGEVPPRIAGVSAFGAGGSNAHVVIAEHLPTESSAPPSAAVAERVVVPLSARTEEQLTARAEQLVDWLDRPENANLSLADIAYTLQVGREALAERIGVVAISVPDLTGKLREFLSGESGADEVLRGSATRGGAVLTLFAPDADLDAMIAAWADKGKYEKLLELWVNGVPVSWRLLHSAGTARRIALPTYPFARERCFAFSGAAAAAPPALGDRPPPHPLVQVNTSDFTEQRFTSVVTGQEHFLRDDPVHGARTMPEAAFLEMAVAASCLSSHTAVAPSAPVALRDVVLGVPLVLADGPRDVHIGLRPEDDGDIRFHIRSTPHGADDGADDDAVPHSHGVLYFVEAVEETVLDVPALRQECDGSAGGQALVRLALPEAVRGPGGDFVLHPGLLDAALRAGVDVLGGPHGHDDGGRPLPCAIDEVLVLDACPDVMWAWVRRGTGQSGDATDQFDIDLADEQGRVRARIGGLSFRIIDESPRHGLGQEELPELDQATLDHVISDLETSQRKSFGLGEGSHGGQAVLLCSRWQRRPVSTTALDSATRPTVLVAGAPEVAAALRAGDDSDVILLTTRDETIDGRYAAFGAQMMELLRPRMRGTAGRSHVQLVVPGTSDAAPLSGLAAVLRTAHLENPNVTGQVVVLDPMDTAERVVARIRENRRCPGDTLVRYVDGHREVRTWTEDATALSSALPWKENGVYLVVGGAGALGRAFAREIVAQVGNATVVLAGRSPSSPDRLGIPVAGSVRYEQADISVRAEADALVARTLALCGRIDGVVHSAGVTRDALIVDKSVPDFVDVLAPKVAGMVNLDAATRSLPLDFFMAFSSTSGVTGSVGQVDVAAANAFLDAYVCYRQGLVARGERFGNSQSVIWPLRAGVDLLLDADAGIRCLHRIVRSEHSQVMVSAPVPGDFRDEPDVAGLLFPVSSTAGMNS